jgi:hypothetical protein
MLVLVKLKLVLLQFKKDYKMGRYNNTLTDEQEEILNEKDDELLKIRKQAKDAINDRSKELDALVANRQDVINPYANLTNEFANLGVATQAAEFQAEQTDIALANTLDNLAATGASAGGATALAQAALRSKKGISASLQQQEAANQKAAAQGAANVARMKAEGEKFAFSITEGREQQEIDRQSNLLDQEKQALNDVIEQQQDAEDARFASS